MKLDFHRKDLYVVDNAYSAQACREIIADATFTLELTNKFGEKFIDRAMRNDRGAVTRKTYGLLAKVRDVLPEAKGLNPLVRLSKYGLGGRCAAHTDAQFKTSTHTVLVFLSTPKMGGETRFHHRSSHTDVKAVAGRMVIFGQDLVHESIEVLAGVKYTMRTDVLMSPVVVRRVPPRKNAKD